MQYKRIINCKHCGNEFHPPNYRTKFCNRDCYMNFRRGKTAKEFYGESIANERRKKCSIAMKGKLSGNKNPMWKGGKVKIFKYMFIKIPEHPYSNPQGYYQEHRLIMEQKLNRYLKPEEVVHHINENKLDNRIENLKLFENNGLHQAHHLKLKRGKYNE